MAKKKRSASLQEDSEDETVDHRSEDEVMVEAEEEERNEESASERETLDGEIPFLDSFYGLASPSPVERSKSAHAMLQHCLLGPSANTKDAAYSFRRLLNGLCSGRAAARQGYASALTSFVKIAYATGALKEIRQELAQDDDNSTEESILAFVRNELLKTTDPSSAQNGKFGKAKGSEERDYQFGRLFGILAIVRSGILLPSVQNDLSEAKITSTDLVDDLIELYHHKKWMREPAAHGIISLMNSLYCDTSNLNDSKIVLDHVVRKAIVSNLLVDKALGDYTAEQIAVAVSIQTHVDFFEGELPSPLDQAIVSCTTIPTLVGALCTTSSVVHPRMHVVWDVLWLFLSEAIQDSRRLRTLRDSCPIGGESASRAVEALMESLVTQSLLEMGTEGENSSPTHERRALALTIVRAACGGEITSSTGGTFSLSIDPNLIGGSVLSPDIVKRLFLDVICAGGSAKQGAHMLKPMALHVLGEVAESNAVIDVSCDSALRRRLSLAEALLECDPRFDGKTKTTTISNLLLLHDSVEVVYSKALVQMWTNYIEFLESRILRPSSNDEGNDNIEKGGERVVSNPSSYGTLGYVDLLYNAGKRFLRLQVNADNEAEFDEFRSAIIGRILGFLMATAFFDCSNLTEQKKSKRKKGRKQSFDVLDAQSISTEGHRVKKLISSQNLNQPVLAYELRSSLSSRFFSLLADCTSLASSSQSSVGSSSQGQRKDARVLGVVSNVMNGWTLLEECGAQRLAADEKTDSDMNDELSHSVEATCSKVRDMQREALSQIQKSDDESLSNLQCTVGVTILASTLCLQFLRCGESNEIIDEIEDNDDEGDDEDVVEMINDLRNVSHSLLEPEACDESSDTEARSPLLILTELCIHVLSSPVGSGGQSRGASPKLLREAVKFAWIGGLSFYASVGDDVAVGDDVLSALLDSIGASPAEDMTARDRDGDESDSEASSDGDESENNDAVFSQVAGEALGIDDNSDVEMKDEAGEASSDDEEEELDTDQLKSLLLEDGDAILDDDDDNVEGELEHHAGADAALARLIKLKQDARKAGRQALERIEITKQLRCVMLIETLLSNPGRRWGRLLQTSLLVKMLLPLVETRRGLEKALERASADQLGKKSSGLDSDRQALLVRLTSLLKTKVCKIRWSKENQPGSRELIELSSELMNQARRSKSNEQSSCCSLSLLALLKSISDVDVLIKASRVYGEALSEWATKRTSKLQSSLFDDFIQQLPSLAQIVLVIPLATASNSARPFLKLESFRLLGILFSRSAGNGSTSQLDRWGFESLKTNSCGVVRSISLALQDEEMCKTKRVKEVLKAGGKIVAFQKAHPDSSVSSQLLQMKDTLEQVRSRSDNSGVTSVCEKLESEIDECLKQLKQASGSKERASEAAKKKKKKKSKKKQVTNS